MTGRGEGMASVKDCRPVALIRLELETAMAYQERYRQRPSADPLVLSMRAANEAEVRALEAELAEATRGCAS